MKHPLVIHIQKYSIHDGKGIRTTVFFKGCPLSCLWCHNPESQSREKELLFDDEKCSGCGLCIRACKRGAVSLCAEGKSSTDPSQCILCGNCIDYCMSECREIAGKSYSVEELTALLKKDRAFYEQSGGGVTLSGGEVMMQDMDYIEALCRGLKDEGISINIDTCGFAPREHFMRLLPYVDEFLYDIKGLDKEKHKRYTGADNTLILDNLKFLMARNAGIWIRIPVIPGVNDSEEEMRNLACYLREGSGISKISLLPYHHTGSSKYRRLGKEYLGTAFSVPEEEKMENLKKMFHEYGFFEVKIGG